MTRRRTSLVLAAAVLAISLLASACGGSGTTGSTERPLTSEEAAALADALYLNWQDQGATFTANAAWTSVGRTIVMQGEVDWTKGQGHAFVRSTGADVGLTEVWWSNQIVIERWPALEPVFAGLGATGAKFISRAPDPDKRLVDHVIAIISGLASQQRENPLLIQQKPGSEFMRDDELRGTAVQVLRYGERNLYWLAIDGGRMQRFDGNTSSGVAPSVVDILTSGPQTITPPPVDAILPSSAIASVYTSLTSG